MTNIGYGNEKSQISEYRKVFKYRVVGKMTNIGYRNEKSQISEYRKVFKYRIIGKLTNIGYRNEKSQISDIGMKIANIGISHIDRPGCT